jgi:hypothetical protein
VGYSVRTSGRLHLPEAHDDAAVTAVKAAWATRSAGLDLSSATLAGIAWVAAASITRDGDWIGVGSDEDGDAKWSDLATAFYVELAPFVRAGAVHVEGEDEERWSYDYAGGTITQRGRNGWDGSTEPFGDYTEEG